MTGSQTRNYFKIQITLMTNCISSGVIQFIHGERVGVYGYTFFPKTFNAVPIEFEK